MLTAVLSVEQRQRWEGERTTLVWTSRKPQQRQRFAYHWRCSIAIDLRQLLAYEFGKSNTQFNRAVVLDALTTVRHQTAMDETGVPKNTAPLRVRIPGDWCAKKQSFMLHYGFNRFLPQTT